MWYNTLGLYILYSHALRFQSPKFYVKNIYSKCLHPLTERDKKCWITPDSPRTFNRVGGLNVYENLLVRSSYYTSQNFISKRYVLIVFFVTWKPPQAVRTRHRISSCNLRYLHPEISKYANFSKHDLESLPALDISDVTNLSERSMCCIFHAAA